MEKIELTFKYISENRDKIRIKSEIQEYYTEDDSDPIHIDLIEHLFIDGKDRVIIRKIFNEKSITFLVL